MSKLFKGAALLIMLTAIVWVAVLWHWESTNRNMTILDIVVFLALLPLAAFGALLGLHWAWRGARPRHEAAMAATAARGQPGAAAAPNAAEASAEEARRHAVMLLLGAHLASPAGASAAELLAAVADGKPAPELDADLLDADGMRQMCARIKDTSSGAELERIEAVLDAVRKQRPDWADMTPDEHVLRGLAALAAPFAQALHGLQPWSLRLGVPDPDARAPAPGLAAVQAPSAMVRLLLGWPSAWSEFERELATATMRRHIVEHTDIPPDRFVVAAHPVASGAELWLKADRLLVTLLREGREDLVLVAACHSDLSDACVAALAQQQRLFSPQHRPKGLMPGEGAAALVLANASWPVDPDAYQRPARLHRPAVVQRDKSIEAAGRVSSQSTEECAQQAMAAARIAPADVAALVCDADLHTPRGPEVFGAAQALVPHLAAGEDLLLIGNVTAHTGATSVLLVIAAAAQKARADGKPCLAVSAGDAFARVALVVRPPLEPAAEPA